MRILVISDLPAFVTGGAEMQAARLIDAWSAMGHEVTCVGRRMGAEPVVLGGRRIETGRIRTWPLLGRPGRALGYFLSLAGHLLRRRNRVDLVYSRFLGDAAATVALLRSLGLLAAPYVATPANAGVHGDIAYLRSVPGSDRLIRLIDRECAAINLIAPGMADDLARAGFRHARLTRIPNGIALRPLVRQPRTGPIRAVCVGRLAKQKGYDLLAQALALAPELAGRLQVDVIGEGPERRDLEVAFALAPAGMVRLLGEMPVEAVQEQLAQSDFFLLPSRYEGLSNAALEALERGLPILTTRCGGIDVFLDQRTGWQVDAGDVAGLADALRRACATPRDTLAEMGRAARALAEREFDMQRVARRYLELFTDLVDENRGHRP